jgi:hypothetical protein
MSDVIQELTRFDQSFKGCVVDFYLSAEDMRLAENAAPMMPPYFTPGSETPGAPRVLREASLAISTALRYSMHSLQQMHEVDRQAAGDLMASVRLQMVAATRVHEAMFSATYNIDPDQMRANLMRERMPQTVIPFMQKFFRAGAGGTTLSGVDDTRSTAAAFPVGADSHLGSPSPTAAGCTVIVAPSQAASPTGGSIHSAAPQEPPGAPLRAATQAALQLLSSQVGLQGAVPPSPQPRAFAEPGPPFAQEPQPPSFTPFPSSPRSSPFAPPYATPFGPPPQAFGFGSPFPAPPI